MCQKKGWMKIVILFDLQGSEPLLIGIDSQQRGAAVLDGKPCRLNIRVCPRKGRKVESGV